MKWARQHVGRAVRGDVVPWMSVGGSDRADQRKKSNNLRQLHTFDINSDVQFVPEVAEDEASAGQGMNMGIPIAIAIAIAVAIAAVVIIRRRKKSVLRRAMTERKQDDIESLLDSHRAEKRLEDGRK